MLGTQTFCVIIVLQAGGAHEPQDPQMFPPQA
jgi:hypothetical protein